MNSIQKWLREYKFQAHLTAFVCMILTSAGMYCTARSAAVVWMWALIALFACANILALGIK